MILLYLLTKNFYTALVFPLKTPGKNTFQQDPKNTILNAYILILRTNTAIKIITF